MPRTIVHDKRTKTAKQKLFLAKFSDMANISRAAKASKIGRQTVYDWLENDPEFKKKYELANKIALGVIEDEATRRAIEGTSKPVFQGGKKVGTVKEFSDTLLIVLLKARAPEKYKDRQYVESKNTNTNFNSVEMSPEEMKAIAKQLEEDV
jgi:hypothetical protein